MLERLIDGPQGRLNLSENQDGSRAPVLFVHSDAGNLHHWDNIRGHLKHRPSAAFDRRGHGRSAPPANGSFDHRDSAADIAAVADALGYERYFLVGHSGGALTAFAYASLAPDRLIGLVLVDPPPDPEVLPPGMIEETLQKLRSDAYPKTLDTYFRGIAGDNKPVIERVLADARATPKETTIGTLEANARFAPREFTSYEGPALSIIQLQNDADGALHRIAKMECLAIDGAGHWIHLAAPERFIDVLEEFMEDFETVKKDGARAEPRTGAAD